MFYNDIPDALQFLGGVYVTRGIGGIAQQDGLGAAGSDDNIFRSEFHAKPLIVVNKLLPQGQIAVRGAVFQRFTRDVLEGIQALLRGGKVRLADVQMIHFHALTLGLVGQGGELADGG